MSAKRIELLASAAQTASGNSAAFDVPTLTMAMVGIDITVDDFTDFDAWLEGSDDNGTTWYALEADSEVVNSTRVDAQNQVDIASSASGVEKYSGVFKHLATDKVRLAWSLTGTSITFSASLVGK